MSEREREERVPLLIGGRENWKAWNILFGLHLLSVLKQPLYYIIGFSPRCKALCSPTLSGIPFIHPFPSFFPSNNNKKYLFIFTLLTVM